MKAGVDWKIGGDEGGGRKGDGRGAGVPCEWVGAWVGGGGRSARWLPACHWQKRQYNRAWHEVLQVILLDACQLASLYDLKKISGL